MLYIITYFAFCLVMVIVSTIYKFVTAKLGKKKTLRIDVQNIAWMLFSLVMTIWLPGYIFVAALSAVIAVVCFYINRKTKKFVDSIQQEFENIFQEEWKEYGEL